MIKKIIGIFCGTLLLGFGVSLCKISKLGQDPLAGFVSSIQYVTNLNYGICYLMINFIFLLFMVFFLKNKIHIGTFVNVLFTGFFCDLFMNLYHLLNIEINNFLIKLIVTFLGVVFSSLGIAIHGFANLGLSAYEGVCVILNKKFSKISFKYLRIITDLFLTLVTLVICIFFLKRNDIVNINTFLNFILCGPLISLFSKIMMKLYNQPSDFI